MPAPSHSTDEKAIRFSRFIGTNISVDPAALPPNVLQDSANYAPDPESALLVRRAGLRAVGGMNDATTTLAVHAPIRVTDTLGQRWLYAYQVRAGGFPARIMHSGDDGVTWTPVTGLPNFTLTTDTLAGSCRYGDVLYFGNGIDPIKQTILNGTTIDLSAVVDFTDTSAQPSIVADTNSNLLSGTYAYCWGIYDHANRAWLERSQVREVTFRSTGDNSLSFPLPVGFVTNGGIISPNFRAHLFVAAVNYPIELGHDQTPEGITGTATTLRNITASGPPVPHTLARSGSMFVPHRGRIWFAGYRLDTDTVRDVYATNVLPIGYEQAVFDAGDFFPWNARIRIDAPVTGLGVVTLTSTQESPSSPLAIFSESSTRLWLGDIIDDPTSQEAVLSREIGCVSHATIVATPIGLMFVGLQGVYAITPDGNITSVGWPIRKAIRGIGATMRPRLFAVYHEGFYKLFLPSTSQTTIQEMWWLDLNQGLGNFPSWWHHRFGPAGIAPTAAVAGKGEYLTAERLFMFTALGDVLEHTKQVRDDLGSQFPLTIVTGIVDDGDPFSRKIAHRVRADMRTPSTSQVTASVITDNNITYPCGVLDWELVNSTGGQWNSGRWDVSTWGDIPFIEGEAITTDDRPRGRRLAAKIEYTGVADMSLRDVEVRYTTVARPVK